MTCVFAGQMGNQMFEVAAAIGYALDHGCEARFPEILMAKDGEENARYIFHRLNTTPFPPGAEFEHIHGPERVYAPLLKPTEGKHACLSGFFQTEKYFARHSEVIRKLFAPTEEILQEIQAKYGSLLKQTTVGVHVRTFIPDGWDPLAMVNVGYYLQAMSHFPPDTQFLVFSDAMDWTKKSFPRFGKKVTFIEGNPHHIDFYLLSLCDHQIISRHSTFSWWAAWLNPNPNKIVIAADLTKGRRIKDDFLPASWIKY